MNKGISAVIVIILIAVGLYLLYNFGYLGGYSTEDLVNDYKCRINDVDYYVHSDVIYFMSKENKEYIYTDFGVYERKEDKTGWTLTLKAGNYSQYGTIFQWIEDGKHPTAGWIRCKKFTEFPEGFDTFIKMHQIIFDMQKDDFKELE